MDDKTRLKEHLLEIIRDRDPFFASVGHFYVREYIYQKLQQWGTVERDRFQFNGRTHQNLVLKLPSRNPNNKPSILIGAHYDTVPNSSGADDNATGVAVLLELARILATDPCDYPLQLVAFDLEEFGLHGSRNYAQKLRQKKEPLYLAIALEMLGYFDTTPNSQQYPPGLKYFYPDRGDFIALLGSLRTIPDLISLHRNFLKNEISCQWLPVPFRGYILPDTRRSDHAPFWDAGYRGIMVTDTSNFRNPHYHQPSDRLETLNLDKLTAVLRGLVDWLRSL
ncbi:MULTISPECIES: M28 family peptidase [Spirulina sp. CCY15215]|uniref:M28 family peptidase n=1 Tax=Spirulina sp. CCY15215 TaxID=2767591 RepID=UPI00194FDC38|nr:M28 family peptidase [Spirulina major]